MPETTPESIDQLKREAFAALEASENVDSLENWRIEFLGRSGKLTSILRSLGTLPQESRAAVGQAANRARQELEAAFAERSTTITESAEPAGIGQRNLQRLSWLWLI